MELLKHGLALTAIPFISIFVVVGIFWGLVDLSLKKVKGRKRALWSILAILLPPVATLLHDSVREEEEPNSAG